MKTIHVLFFVFGVVIAMLVFTVTMSFAGDRELPAGQPVAVAPAVVIVPITPAVEPPIMGRLIFDGLLYWMRMVTCCPMDDLSAWRRRFPD